jgi:hypothetical protein
VMLAATVREALIEHGVEVRPALPSP